MNRTAMLVLLAVVLAWTVPVLADNTRIQAGWVGSDTGLQDDGNGLWAGVEGRRPLGPGPLDLGYGLAYLQKKGAVRMIFSDPVAGNRLAAAEVTLHTLRATADLGLRTDLGPLGLRLFAGGAVDLKVSESWAQPTGGTDRRYGYNDLDLVALMGLDVEVGPLTLIVARDLGLREMVLVDGVVLPEKGTVATDPLGGESLPGPGGSVSSWRVGLGWRFGVSGR